MRPLNYKAFDRIDAAIAGSQNSAPISGEFMFRYSFQVLAEGAPVGTLKIQASNDSSDSPSNWSDIPSASISVPSAGLYLFTQSEVCYQYIRAVYTKTSGTGFITCVIKMLGA